MVTSPTACFGVVLVPDLLPFSLTQVVSGHRICQWGGSHVPHAEAEEASRGTCQVRKKKKAWHEDFSSGGQQ